MFSPTPTGTREAVVLHLLQNDRTKTWTMELIIKEADKLVKYIHNTDNDPTIFDTLIQGSDEPNS